MLNEIMEASDCHGRGQGQDRADLPVFKQLPRGLIAAL